MSGNFPEPLRTLTNPEVVALLAGNDATPDSTLGSGAIDWSVLAQRLHFIGDFFRAYQEDRSLFQSPFAPMELESIEAGRVPDRA